MIEVPYTYARSNQLLLDGNVIYYTQATSTLALAEINRRQQADAFEYRQIDKDELFSKLQAHYESQATDSLAEASSLESVGLNTLAEEIPDDVDLLDESDDAPIIRLVNALFSDAIRQDASDIHIETFEKRLLVRFRIDGVLQSVVELKPELAPMLVSRVKVMARLDIAEKRVPQDGRTSLKVGLNAVDVRVSTMPGNYGERVVLRLLRKSAARLDLDAIGMSEQLRENWASLLTRPHGILLVTGPTGSGKSTTLYASLLKIRDGHKNILTIEDPIEYDLDGVGQTQINLRADMTFARGLRAMLRQDPDIVMVGEIRDLETAQIAIQASLTGHLVLSTLHTNTAAGSITRLVEMGVEPFLLASSINGVLAQRLVRLLCPLCKQPDPDPADSLSRLGWKGRSASKVFQPVGCDACHDGYAGRTAIYNLLTIDSRLKKLIQNKASEAELAESDAKGNHLAAAGLDLVLQGNTTVSEVVRVTVAETGD